MVEIPISSEEYKKVTEELYKQNLEVVRLYKQVDELNKNLAAANEGQTNLLHILNHQIKGYLTKARLIFDDLLNDPEDSLPEKAKPMLTEGFKTVTEGVTFVQDFLNASNVERGTFTYEMKPLDFKKIVTETAEQYKKGAEEKGLQFGLAVATGEYEMIGDATQLSQVVRNLIDNAVKYTSQGFIKVELGKKDEKILFSVSDSGVGLSDELKPKLFTKGGRDKDSQKINVDSTGFGLAFVKGVTEAHNGRTWAESAGPGKGSTFSLELPINS